MSNAVPVVKYAKPRPKKPVNEQGVPIRQKPLPSKPKASTPQSVKYPAIGGNLTPSVEEETPSETETPEVAYQPVPETPQRAFGDLPEETFPVSEFGADTSSLLDPAETGDQGGMHFAQSLDEVYPQSDRANRARQIISAASQMHGNGNTQRIHRQNVQTDIPVGHARVMPLIPSAPNIAHVVKVHYPQGQVTTYRARLNDDDTGYR